MKTTSKAPEATIDYPSRDARHWQRMEALIQSQGFRLKDALRYFPAYVRRRELPRFLAHYELFKQIVDLPGSIVEVGVYRGAGLFTWTKLMETFCPGDRYRMVYGFDQFSAPGIRLSWLWTSTNVRIASADDEYVSSSRGPSLSVY